MPNILGMENWNVLSRETGEDDTHITAQYTAAPAACVRCGTENPNLKKYGVEEQLFMDSPIHGKRVGIKVMRQRYRCRDCDGTFQEVLPDMDDKRHMTRRLLEYVRQRSLERTFAEVAADVGLDEKSVRNIFREHVTNLDRAYHPETPRWLGIDELHLMGKARCVLANVERNTMIDILETRNKPMVAKWLVEKLTDRSAVEVVAMDMWEPYLDAVRANLPKAKVVVDKFHVVRMANLCLDRVRKEARAGMTPAMRRRMMRDRHVILRRRKDLQPFDYAIMESWTQNLPELGLAYKAKEDFYEIWDLSKDRAEAEARYIAWRDGLPPKTRIAFHELVRAVDNWHPHVMNYFDIRVTNAFTESLNGLTRVVNRMGRGYSFAAIRAKMLFGHARHVERPAFGSGKKVAALIKIPADYGVSLPRLIELYSSAHEISSDTLKSG